MSEEIFEETKALVLAHIQQLFKQMEEDMVISHQEKYNLLEDSLEQASDTSELRVAFDQWYGDHAEEIEFEHDADDLWDNAVNGDDDDDDIDW